ncbi:adenosylcobinamide-GDP ribazoletransferase [Novosphingobium profundi]|uniref:adenosylcobinamide-GDP ribazoletransferase n=1 Tax=Novosphingobium profundi TaxID=1774954 RepID=UPI001BDA90FF|nr:adenosylcobinamide-GDP ribazoletransferase [Novosphingobium profundi]
MKAALLALQLMTRLPLPDLAADSEDFARAIRWFPLAGIVVGVAVAGAAWTGLHRGDALGALCALLAWVGITGALHLDGLGDIADAAGAAHGDRARLSAVLADPHIGSFGVTAIALQLIAKFALLWHVLERPAWAALVLVPVLARVGPLIWARLLPPLHEGMGTLFTRGATHLSCATWLLIVAGLAAWIAPVLLVGLAAMALWALWLKRRIGGLSGDGHGAGIELVETVLLAALVVAA